MTGWSSEPVANSLLLVPWWFAVGEFYQPMMVDRATWLLVGFESQRSGGAKMKSAYKHRSINYHKISCISKPFEGLVFSSSGFGWYPLLKKRAPSVVRLVCSLPRGKGPSAASSHGGSHAACDRHLSAVAVRRTSTNQRTFQQQHGSKS